MARARQLSEGQKILFDYLRQCENKNKQVTLEEIATNNSLLELSTIRTYKSKGYLTDILFEQPNGKYAVKGVANLSESEFHQKITQTQTIRELGYSLKYPQSKALVKKARDNMILALELYNRPSLENRLDGFVMLFCTAWEQLLKAEIMETQGEDEIFKPAKIGRRRETISLANCIKIIYPSNGNPIRLNLENIKNLRDKAIHLLMPETQSLVSRIFQAGVFNFSKKFLEVVKSPFLEQQSVGLITLVTEQEPIESVKLTTKYGSSTAQDIIDILERLEDQINAIDDIEFAIPIDYKLVFTKNANEADFSLTSMGAASHQAFIVEKTVGYEKTHPYSYTKLIKLIFDKLRQELSNDDLIKRQITNSKGEISFNTHHLNAILFKEGWKKANNEYHHKIADTDLHKYSPKAVDYIVDKIICDIDYVKKAKSSWNTRKDRNG